MLGVVQARSGSRGLPGKNVRLLRGKPLMAWMIEHARAARRINRLILSTDSEEYAEIGRRFGAETPFLRPAELATDEATDLQVMTHALRWLAEKEGYRPGIAVRLQPTNPTFPTERIDEGIGLLLEDPEADSVRPVTPTPKHPYKMWCWDPASPYVTPLMEPTGSGFAEPYNMGRSLLPKVYVQVGAMEAVRSRVVLETSSMAGKKIRGFLVSDPLHTVNIDTELDFLAAEAALKTLLEQEASENLRAVSVPSAGIGHWVPRKEA